MNTPTIDSLVMTNMTRIAHDALRYGAIKRLTPRQFRALHDSTVQGKSFDELVDMLVIEMHTDKFTKSSMLADQTA